MHPKYPRTPYWPKSPTQGRPSERHESPEVFVGPEVVVTEKLDGGNTMIHRGEVYARTVSGFARNVCKSVRPNHVQTPEHWRRHWNPTKTIAPHER